MRDTPLSLFATIYFKSESAFLDAAPLSLSLSLSLARVSVLLRACSNEIKCPDKT